MTPAGQLNRRVTLQTATKGQDAYGGPTLTYADLATVWGRVRQLSGRELERARQLAAQADHEVVIRYRTDVTTTSRVVYGTRTFELQAVVDIDDRREDLQLLCRDLNA